MGGGATIFRVFVDLLTKIHLFWWILPASKRPLEPSKTPSEPMSDSRLGKGWKTVKTRQNSILYQLEKSLYRVYT